MAFKLKKLKIKGLDKDLKRLERGTKDLLRDTGAVFGGESVAEMEDRKEQEAAQKEQEGVLAEREAEEKAKLDARKESMLKQRGGRRSLLSGAFTGTKLLS